MDKQRSSASWVLLLFVVLIVLPLGAFAAWTWATLHFSYATGDRAGYIQKFSQKGWFCKTWEGELAMMNLPGSMPEIFSFSVRDNQVAEQVRRYTGQRVTLTYEQHKAVPTNCFAETEYYVTKVTPINENPVPAQMAPAPNTPALPTAPQAPQTPGSSQGS
jgi:hypothetical protein